MKTQLSILRALSISFCMALLAAGPAVAATSDTNLMRRGWAPYLAPAGDNATDAEAVALVRNHLRWQHAILKNLELDEPTEKLSDEAWSSIKDFDLQKLFDMLPQSQPPWRLLTLTGRLNGSAYQVGQNDAATLDDGVPAFGQVRAQIAARQTDDDRGTVYSLRQKLHANVGSVRWPGVVTALQEGLRHTAYAAPAKASDTAMKFVEAASTRLSQSERQILTQLATAFPAGWQWFASYGEVLGLIIEPDSADGVRHIRVGLRMNEDRLERAYPEVADYMRTMGDLVEGETRLHNERGQWMIARVNSASRQVELELWIDEQGRLLPTRNGEVVGRALGSDNTSSLSWTATTTATLRALGLAVELSDWTSEWQYSRTSEGATFQGRVNSTPGIDVLGRALGVMPANVVEFVLPVNIKETVQNFMDVLAESNDGRGAELKVQFAEDPANGSVVSSQASGDGLDNFFVRFGVGMVSNRILPDSAAADGLRRFLGDGQVAFEKDLDRFAQYIRVDAESTAQPQRSYVHR